MTAGAVSPTALTMYDINDESVWLDEGTPTTRLGEEGADRASRSVSSPSTCAGRRHVAAQPRCGVPRPRSAPARAVLAVRAGCGRRRDADADCDAPQLDVDDVGQQPQIPRPPSVTGARSKTSITPDKQPNINAWSSRVRAAAALPDDQQRRRSLSPPCLWAKACASAPARMVS